MAKIPDIEFKCEKCGKPQLGNKKEFNENWNVYDCNQKCGCGGKFCRYIDGHKIG